jgi:hypothetical protein
MWSVVFGAVGLLVIGCIIVTIVVLLARGRVGAAAVTGIAFAIGAGAMCVFFVAFTAHSVVVQQDGHAIFTEAGHQRVYPTSTTELLPPTPRTVAELAADRPPSQLPAPSVETASTLNPEPAILPAWVAQPEATSDAITTLVLSSQRFVTQEEAEEQLTTELVNRTRQYFHDEHPSRGTWTLPADYAVRSAVKQRHVEIISKTFGGDVTVDMKRIHWQVQLSPEMRRDLYPLWRTQVVEQRLIQLGGGVGFATFLLLTGMTYFRVDTHTQGAYRGWLRFAALSVAAAGTAAACLVA